MTCRNSLRSSTVLSFPFSSRLFTFVLPFFTVLVLLLVPFSLHSHAAQRDELLVDALVANLTHPSQHYRVEAIQALGELKNPAAIPALIELLRFNELFGISPVPVLEKLTGEKFGEAWDKWHEWLQAHEEIRANKNFLAWKANVYTRIDPAFENFLYPGVPYRLRLEEMVWGGVRKDGIPALTNPKHVSPGEAKYLTPHEPVFGVSINNDHRAYPLRILDWHEMFNDVVGGKAVTLSY
ncbi:MAG: DUF3179 domain-containing protein [Deltaproteobacteria bacterium]|nr:DUF3179 domain-containing protein [Deltaproteobacteria bacterium]